MTATNVPDLRHFRWLSAALILALLPHTTRFSPVIIACFIALALWRLFGYLRSSPLPDRAHRALWLLKLGLGLGAFLIIWASYRGQPGRDAGVALLILLVGLKLIELKTARDYYVLCCLGYFLVVTNFLYAETIPVTAYLAAVVLLFNASLLAFHAGERVLRPRWCIGRAGLMTLQALPIAILAFVLVPRIEGPLWGRPTEGADAVSGLSDEMSPGTITSLSLSDAIAFRVKFDGAVPPPDERYWRGPVLWNTDGRTWRAGIAGDGPTIAITAHGPVYRYTVTLEPHGKRWLFGLEMPSSTGPLARSRSDLLLLARYPVRRRISYELSSHTNYRVTTRTERERNAALALPAGFHPRARELAERWRAEAGSDRAIVDRALRYFNEQAFFYTLTPPALPRDPVDDFLFATRSGFCEHYASSFVVLMRAAGVPARVVTGYQGGEFNPIGDYLIVRQRDAHAWAEVWLASEGWVRVDPTAAVAPERLSVSIEELLPVRGLLGVRSNPATRALWRSLRRGWDAVNYRWTQWVVGYTPVRQRQLLGRIGLDAISPGSLAGMALAAVGAALFAIGMLVARPRHAARDPVVRAYQRFCRRLARIGCTRGPNEGPLDFAARVARERSALAAPVAGITESYIGLRYGRERDARHFVQQVRRFRP